MSGWRWASRVGRREAVDKFWTDRMETMSTSIVAEYENKLAEMQAELNQSHSVLEQERAMRNQLYEDLMGQFRRGVCAFNLEALGVLKPTDEAARMMSEMGKEAPPSRSMASANGMPSFDEMDRNGDGVLDRQEYDDAMRHMKKSASAPMQQCNAAPTVTSHMKSRSGLSQGKVTVRSTLLHHNQQQETVRGMMGAVEQENFKESSKPLVQRNIGRGVPSRRTDHSDQHTPRLREIPPSAHPHATQFQR